MLVLDEADEMLNKGTVKILNFLTPEKIAVIMLKFEQHGFTVEKCVKKMKTESKTM